MQGAEPREGASGSYQASLSGGFTTFSWRSGCFSVSERGFFQATARNKAFWRFISLLLHER